eukprot:scaffold2820_cov77-Attheya_sp.AAC.3
MEDGRIDSDGNPLVSVVGVGLSLGPMLGAEEGSTNIDGVDDGTILGFEDGSIDAEGKVLSSIVGVRLTLGLMLGVDAGSMDIDGFTEDDNSLGAVVGVRLMIMIGPMLGAENGSTDIDGEDEGLIDGPILVVGVDDGALLDGSMLVVGSSLGFFVGDTVGSMLDFKDGAIDSDRNPLGSVVGERLTLGPILDTVGRRLPLKDGSIDADGIPLIFIVGEILMLGPMLGLETGSNDVDGCNAGLLDDGCIDMSGTLVGFRDGGVIVLMGGAWAFQLVNVRLLDLNSHSVRNWVEKSVPRTMSVSMKVLHCVNPMALGWGCVTPMAACWASSLVQSL